MTELPGSQRHGRVSRRGFIIGAAATGVLAACGSGDDAATSPTLEEVVDPPDTPGTYTLVQRFPQNVQEPGSIRLAMSLGTDTGALVQDGPDTLGAVVTDVDGNQLGDRITAGRRDVAPGPYYDFRTDVAAAGIYYLVVDGGPEQGAAFQVMEPGTVAVPGPGSPLPPFDTPTFDDARGIDLVCTREPEPCPFHDQTLTQALASGKGVVYLVGTPAFCSTGTCAPALESIIELQPDYADRYAFVHAEVYTDDTATEPAPAVGAVGLTYEPALFVTDATGTVLERLDAVWDRTELAEVLDRNG
ncbi:MAG TPA: twin-arginine translocation signal domain-containing protein [Ilumatobacteraceae bacterium]|nr:twin-arginine translocation signal domain-containing protein [Ilumatobacteraceae bacterium]